MSSKHNTSQERKQKRLPFRHIACITCDEGYIEFIPAPCDPRALREKFRRHPFGAPKKTPYQMLGTLNHEDIAPLPPAVVPDQEAHPLFTDLQRRRLERAKGAKDDEGWGDTFLPDYSRFVLATVLNFLLQWVDFLGSGVQWLFDIVGSGPFLPVFTSCSIYWWYTSTGAEPFWLQCIVAASLVTSGLFIGAKYILGR